MIYFQIGRRSYNYNGNFYTWLKDGTDMENGPYSHEVLNNDIFESQLELQCAR